jgi:hypothetical protein
MYLPAQPHQSPLYYRASSSCYQLAQSQQFAGVRIHPWIHPLQGSSFTQSAGFAPPWLSSAPSDIVVSSLPGLARIADGLSEVRQLKDPAACQTHRQL